MATSGSPRLVDKLNWYTTSRAHSVWDRFPAEDKESMLADDLAAGTSVSLELTALISVGLVLSIVTLIGVLVMQS